MPYVHKLGEYHIGQRFKDEGIITGIFLKRNLKATLEISTFTKERKEVKIHRVSRHVWEPIRG